MALDPTKVIAYSGLSYSESEGGTVGGGIDVNGRVDLPTDTGGSFTMEQSNTEGDTRNSVTRYRTVEGPIDELTVAFSGTPNAWVDVNSVVGANRLIKWSLQGVPGLGVFTLRDKGTQDILAQIDVTNNPDLRYQRRLFPNSKADKFNPRTFYEKTFWRNENSGAVIEPTYRITADPDAKIKQGIHPSKNDTVSTGNTTAPSGVTFVDDNVDQVGPDLLFQDRQGVWWQMSVIVENPPLRSSFTSQVSYAGI